MIKKIFLVMSTLIMTFSVIGVPVGEAINSDVSNPYTVLNKKEAREYINLVSESNLYKNIVSDKKIKDVEVILIQAGENIPEDVIVVNGNVNGKENNAVQVLINVDTKEIIKLTHVESTGITSNDTYELTTYDNKGQLRVSAEGTIGALQKGHMEVKKEKIEGPQLRAANSDIWWACQFSSLVICLGAAGVNILLGLACKTAFKLAAC